jgi:hypothetical protein
VIKRFLYLFLVLIAVISCKKEEPINKTVIKTQKISEDGIQLVKSDQLSDFFGEYEYKNIDNSQESLFLILKKVETKSIADFEGYSWEEKNEKGEVVEKTLTGLFYGNTDLFEEAREGYAPGFFVANVQVEPSGENSLKVNLHANSSDILENPVQPTIKSTKEALEKGNKKWQITEIDISRELIFEIKNSNELILKSDLGLADKTFELKSK